MLHNPHYDFNDAVLPWGASYWVRLAEYGAGEGTRADRGGGVRGIASR